MTQVGGAADANHSNADDRSTVCVRDKPLISMVADGANAKDSKISHQSSRANTDTAAADIQPNQDDGGWETTI